MALIDKTTDITSFDYKKVRGTNTTENGTFKTNQRNNTDKKTNFNNTKIEQQYSKLSPDDGQLIKKDIGDKYRSTKLDFGLYRGGAALNVERNVEDVERIGKFLTTPKGLLFAGKQVILQKQNASKHTRGYKPESLITPRLPFNSDERHKAGGLFSSPFSDAPKYEEAKFTDNIVLTKGKISNEDNKKQVQPIRLKSKKGRSFLELRDVNTDLKREQERTYGTLNKTTKPDPNSLNPKITRSDKNYIVTQQTIVGPYSKMENSDKDKLPKDFIDFRIKDMVNDQYIQFPAYITDISDNSSAEYNPTRYIGRPDQVFVYSGYSRNISFGFRVASLTKGDIPILWRKVDKLKLLTLPTFSKKVVQDDGEERPIAPFVELTLGNLFRAQPGYFSSVNVTIPQTSTWELDDGHQLPHICDVTVEFTFVGRTTPQNFHMSHNAIDKGGKVIGVSRDGLQDVPNSYDLGTTKD